MPSVSVPYTNRTRHPGPQLAALQVPIAVALRGRTKASLDPSAALHKMGRRWAALAALAALRGRAGPEGIASVAVVLRNANLSSDMSPSWDDPADPLAAVAAHASVVPAIFALAVSALVAFVPVPSAPEAFAPAVCTVPEQLVAVALLATAAAAAALRVDAALASGHCCRSQGEVPARAAQLLAQHPAHRLKQRSLCYLVEGHHTAMACADLMDLLAFPARDILGHCVASMGPDSSGSREWSSHHQLEDRPRQGPAKQC